MRRRKVEGAPGMFCWSQKVEEVHLKRPDDTFLHSFLRHANFSDNAVVSIGSRSHVNTRTFLL